MGLILDLAEEGVDELVVAVVAAETMEQDLESRTSVPHFGENRQHFKAWASEDEARRRMRRSLAVAIKSKKNAVMRVVTRWLEETLSDIRFAVRTLRKAPVFTATVVAASRTFCIGVNTAIFSPWLTRYFSGLCRFQNQGRLVSVTEGVPGLGFPVLPFSPPDYLFVAANNRSFAATGTYRTQSYEFRAQDSRNVCTARV